MVLGHSYSGYIDSLPRFIVEHHRSSKGLDKQGLVDEIHQVNPYLVRQVLFSINQNDISEVVYLYISGLEDEGLKHRLDSNLCEELKHYGSMDKTTSATQAQLNRLNISCS